MQKIDVVVTRHAALITYLLEEGIITAGAKVVSHASFAEIDGKHVVGVLPHSLSCLCASFTEVPLFLPPELRGKELTVSQVREYAGNPATYLVVREEN